MTDVSVFCVTNLDMGKYEIWPRKMSCRPIIGDRVASRTGKVLKVVSITHKELPNGDVYLEIELHN